MATLDWTDRQYWFAFGLTPGLTPQWRAALLQVFGHPREIFSWARRADGSANGAPAISPKKSGEPIESDEQLCLQRIEKIRARLQAFSFARVDHELREIERLRAQLLTYGDAQYPTSLMNTVDPPMFLIVKGQNGPEKLTSSQMLAVVGARNCSSYGCMVTHSLVTALAKMGYIIVSGGARGIDAVAHRATLEVNASTVAVLASGVGCPYPSQHRRLFEEIAESGAVVSEYPCHEIARAYYFPQRNRLIAGLSKGVLVTEAGAKSGSLITAHVGMELGREVMAVPGLIHEDNYRGSHKLLREGAHLVTSTADVLGILGLHEKTMGLNQPIDKVEKAFLERMGSRVASREELYQRSGLTAAHFAKIVLSLEQCGGIYALSGGRYIRSLEGSETLWQSQ